MKKYYLTNRFKLLLAGLFSLQLFFIVPLLLFLGFTTLEKWHFGLAGLFIVAEIIGATIRVYSEYIILSESGITYNTVYFNFKATWPNVESVTSDRWWLFKQEGITVNNSVVKTKNPTASAFMVLTRRVNPKRFIPLGCFAENWRDSELGQQIKQYAPHLFEKEKFIGLTQDAFERRVI